MEKEFNETVLGQLGMKMGTKNYQPLIPKVNLMGDIPVGTKAESLNKNMVTTQITKKIKIGPIGLTKGKKLKK